MTVEERRREPNRAQATGGNVMQSDKTLGIERKRGVKEHHAGTKVFPCRKSTSQG
jgi:hypothetical protein